MCIVVKWLVNACGKNIKDKKWLTLLWSWDNKKNKMAIGTGPYNGEVS